jgi:hypothetical protein
MGEVERNQPSSHQILSKAQTSEEGTDVVENLVIVIGLFQFFNVFSAVIG